jgi:hypothetical protein
MSCVKLAFPFFLACSSLCGFGENAGMMSAAALPAGTTLPVIFVKSIDANNSHVGDAVIAKTMQVIHLPNGGVIPKDTRVEGHVVGIQAFHFDATPYAHQKPSMLSIHFDRLEAAHRSIAIDLSVRAIASAVDSRDAAYPHGIDETDHVGTRTLIGGTTFSPLEKRIASEDGDAIGYNRKDGVFARLIASGACSGSDSEQSVAIYSPDACGVYGMGGDYLVASGREGSGTFTLAQRGHSVKLYAGSTALLQVNETTRLRAENR